MGSFKWVRIPYNCFSRENNNKPWVIWSGFENVRDNAVWSNVLDCLIATQNERYPLVMTNSSPWKDPPFLIGNPSISMGHFPWLC